MTKSPSLLEDESRATEAIVPKDQHAQLGLCPFCAGYGEPYIAQITEDWGDDDLEHYWQARCGHCRARGFQCATLKYAVWDWNDVSLALFPDQTTRWPGSRMCDVKGSPSRETSLPLAGSQAG